MARPNRSELTFHVDPVYPEQTLEHLANQIEMLNCLLAFSNDDLMLSSDALSGICDTLSSVCIAMHEVQELVHAGRQRIS